jgi:exodeoxyribonuclease VIII
MLDLETMGTGTNAAIIAIGAVEFNIKNKTIGDKFYSIVDLNSSIHHGGIIDASSVLWWMKQSDESRMELLKESYHILYVLREFSDFLEKIAPIHNICVWGNGSDFDNVILSSAYRNNGIINPWHFWNNRCYRTIKSFYPDIKINRIGVHHNALNDAESQAIHLMEILQ